MSGMGRVCVIGAGSSGLPVVKALADRGIPFDCFERSDRVGGNWAFGNPNGMSSAYRSLCTNSSRTRTQYADHPMPADYPDFPHHSQMARYFESYARRFGLAERITFRTTVAQARREDGGWTVTLAHGERRRYGVLVVANGHHWDPRWPEPPIPGPFDGAVLHAHHYVDPTDPVDMTGRRVVVVGAGNSAMDIAAELAKSGRADRVYLSARRGAWIIPRTLFGRPVDRLRVAPWFLPWRVQSLAARLMLRLFGPPPSWRHGLPRPDHPPLAAHPTISQEMPALLVRGAVVGKPGLAALEGGRVRFADGSTAEADAIVYCTGYRVSFPFLGPEVVSAPGNDLPLWLRLVRPGETDLFFVGLLQPLGATMPLAEAQAGLVAAHLTGQYAFPPVEAMAARIARERRALARRYVASPRHTMQVDFDRYLHDLRLELRRGQRRAAHLRAATLAAARTVSAGDLGAF
jgi:dimethylaniline monooxygenase (N-oxide forming)